MGGIFARRRGAASGGEDTRDDARVPRGLLMWMLVIIGLLGYIVTKDVNIPGVALATFGGIALAILFFVGLKRPDVPLYVMVAYLPFSKILTGDFGGIMTALNLTNLLLVVILITWFVNTAGARQSFFEPHFVHLPVTLMMLWGIFSFFYAGSRMGNEYVAAYFSELKRWLDPIVMYFLFFHLVKTRQRWKTVVVIIMAAVTMAAVMAIYDYLNVGAGSSLDNSRIGGIAGQPNILGAFFVYYMFLFAAFWLQRIRRPVSWWLLVPFGLCFRAIMVTFSRGAYLAFAQGVLGITFFKNKFLFALAVGALAFSVLNPWILPEGIQYRLSTTFKQNTQLTDTYGIKELESGLDQSSAVRIFIWQGAVKMIQEHPVAGVGLGLFHQYIGLYQPMVAGYDAHNAYLITAAEFGLPGLALLLLVILALFFVSSVVYRRHTDPFIRATALGFLGGLSGLLMANMFGSRLNTTEVSGYFWVLAALMARADQWAKEDRTLQRAAATSARRPYGVVKPAAPPTTRPARGRKW